MKKPRSDSKLANLDEDVQEQIAVWCKAGLEEARERVRTELGISISISSLSCWHAWWSRQQALRAGHAKVMQHLEWYRRNRPDATPDELRAATFHAMAALHADDPEVQIAVLREQGKDMDRELSKKRLQITTCEKFLEWFKDERARQIADGAGTNAQKIEALGQAMFGEDW